MSRSSTPQPIFWRDSRLPHAELRVVEDGRKVCYAPASHALGLSHCHLSHLDIGPSGVYR